MTWFSQTDPRWGAQELGYNTDPYYSIANFGCVVTSWANLLLASVAGDHATPADVNEWMHDHGGFQPGTGIFVWNVALGMEGVDAKGTTSDLAAVNNFLEAAPNFAILELRTSTGRQHFCLAPYVDKLVDSEDGVLKNQSTYTFINSHLYTARSLPAPTPAPTSGALNATVNITVPYLNARTEPNTTSPVAAVFHQGYAHTTFWQVGQSVTVAGRTDNIWLKSDAGHWFAQAGTDANYGHIPAKLKPTQQVHLAASEQAGSVMKALNNKLRRTKK